MQPDDPRHGEERGYFAHRSAGQAPCEPCRTAHRNAEKRRALRRLEGAPAWVPAFLVRRRIEALMALGWRQRDIAEALGYKASHEAVRSLLTRRNVERSTFERVKDVYERLSGTVGPSQAVRARARQKGYAPPLAWDDIDDPAEEPSGFLICASERCTREVVAWGVCLVHYRKGERSKSIPVPNKGGRAARPTVCGTERGYHRHRYQARRGREPWPLPAEDPCGCRAAHSAHEALKARMKKAEAA